MTQACKRYRLHRHSRFRVLDDEGILILQETTEVVVVNEVGAALLRAVQASVGDGVTADELVAHLTDKFEVTADRARDDVRAFTDELRALGAIEAVSA
ncbi:MAG: PqqD family protein [Myxococcales bacterium]|nr:PqqD family protein [Myxococcales bacterium]